ncbi:conserved protein of unknown function [Pseudomonas sp. JV551A1]|nr:conserved protein of unknown function [Pseudomonas sp. JV551A1]
MAAGYRGFLWERPCVAKGPQSGPGDLDDEVAIVGPLRAPFATQGRSTLTASTSSHAP